MASFPNRVSALLESPKLFKVDHIAALTQLNFKFETVKNHIPKKKKRKTCSIDREQFQNFLVLIINLQGID